MVEFLTRRAELVARGEAEPFDSACTDPPYHLTSIVKRFGKQGSAEAKVGETGVYARASRGFMGKEWDGGDVAFRVETWRAVFDNLKPGAYLVAFSGTRTYHRMVCAIEDAGFEIRDSALRLFCADPLALEFMESLTPDQQAMFARLLDGGQFTGMLSWAYGTGFPKSHEVSKQLDKMAGAVREKKRHKPRADTSGTMAGSSETRPWIEQSREVGFHEAAGDEPVTDEAKQWHGWGTALKPCLEPIVLARKPLEGSVARNVLKHGTGALNIDACRIGDSKSVPASPSTRSSLMSGLGGGEGETAGDATGSGFDPNIGRWPGNLIHDGSAEVEAMFPDSDNGASKQTAMHNPGSVWAIGSDERSSVPGGPIHGGNGSAARFFYSSKAGPLDRLGSKHATVKPVDLMRWLVRMVTPPHGHVLDPFAGSGTTGIACMAEGFGCTMLELEAEHVADIERKLAILRGEGKTMLEEKGRKVDPNAGPLFG